MKDDKSIKTIDESIEDILSDNNKDHLINDQVKKVKSAENLEVKLPLLVKAKSLSQLDFCPKSLDIELKPNKTYKYNKKKLCFLLSNINTNKSSFCNSNSYSSGRMNESSNFNNLNNNLANKSVNKIKGFYKKSSGNTKGLKVRFENDVLIYEEKKPDLNILVIVLFIYLNKSFFFKY